MKSDLEYDNFEEAQIIVIHDKNKPIPIWPKPFRDDKLSLEAKGLYICLLCIEEDAIDDSVIAKRCGISLDKFKALLKELHDAGHSEFYYA